jgi:amidase
MPLDMPTAHNSPIYKDDFPKLDAASIILLRHAGALFLGEFLSTTVLILF